MDFRTPQALWFLLVVPFFVLLHFRSFSDMGRFQRGLSLLLRLLILSGIILALADMRLIQKSDKLSVFFLWDGSRSVGQGSTQAMRDYMEQSFQSSDKERDQAGIIAFGRDSFVEAKLGSDLEDFTSVESDIKPDFTDLSSAIGLALASLPPDTGARIVVLSDGNENLGDAVTSARIAANRGIQIDTVPFGQPMAGEVAAGRIILPRRVEQDEMFDVRAVVESERETDATIEVYENEKLIGTQRVHLVPGKNVFTFPRQQTEGGFYGYRVQVLADGDVEAENNKAVDYTIVEGHPKVCYVSGDPNERPYMVDALRREGIVAEFKDISGLPTSLIGMAPYDVIMFSDVGAELLMPDTMKSYQSFVRDLGGGFAMIGGENSFGPGGYFRTPIEEMLPVDLDLTKKEYMPSIGICLVVDKSGSMGMVEGGVEKVEIGKEACRLVVDLLDETDQLGVVCFDFAAQWVVNFQQLRDKRGVINQIGTMRAGGGTSVYAGMEQGYLALRNADVKIRHMIILSDGVTAWADFDGLMRQINDADITVTTVSVGSDANLELMEDLAKKGGGNHYMTQSIQQVPQIFTKETFLMSNRALVEEPFVPLKNQVSPTTEGIDFTSSPPLLGYVATNIKPLATEALTTHRTDPLLAHWQYGLGRSLAYTSDAKAHWGAGWLQWGGYRQMWTQAARWLVGGQMAGNLVPNIYFRAGKAYISVDAIDSRGEIITDASIRAKVACPESDVKELNLFQVAPGRYEASIDATEIGSYLVNIFQEDEDGSVIDQVSSGFSVSYPPEFEKSGPDMFLLSQLSDATGGQLAASAAEVFRHTNQPVSRYFDLWYYLLIAAICLLPIDIAVRRLSLTGESLQYVRERVSSAVTGFLTRSAREREAPTHIDHLKKVKEQYRLTAGSDDIAGGSAEVDKRVRQILAQKKYDSEDRLPVSRKTVGERPRREPEHGKPDEEGSLDRLLRTKKRLRGDDHKP